MGSSGPHDPVLVSACLLGVRCRYDGEASPDPDITRLLDGAFPVPVCPEQLGGLPTPRPPARMRRGDGFAVLEGRARVMDETGADITANFIRGAEEAARIADFFSAKRAILKTKSPSCGLGAHVLDGEKEHGPGVTAALFMRLGIEVVESGGEP